MFPPKSLGLVLTACVYAATARQSLSNLHDDCEFILDGSRYDLCPLFPDRGQGEIVDVHAELISNVYLLYGMSFGGPPSVVQSEEEPGPQCPPEKRACSSERLPASEDSESRSAQLIPIAKRPAIGMPHTTISPRLRFDAFHGTHNGELEINLTEDMGGSIPQVAHFRFICDGHAQEPSFPTFTGIAAGVHRFEWTTPHACAKEPLSFSALEQGEDAAPAGDDAQPEADGGQDLVESTPVHHTIRNLMIGFAVASSAILGLGYLIRYPPPQVKRWVGVTARRLPFRVGEGILVQWAEEAMFINDEEDVMVNYEEEDDFGEQIPLKLSPTRLSASARGFMDYGSARR